MSDYIDKLFKKYKQRVILIDTNILVLWFVGTVNKSRISQFNRTEQFNFAFLLKLLENVSDHDRQTGQ